MFKHVNMFYPISIIGRALKLLLTLDCIINENIFYEESLLKQNWRKYRDAFKLMKITPEKYGIPPEKFKVLERIIVKVDKGVMAGESFDLFLKIISDPSKVGFFEEFGDIKSLKSNKLLIDLFKKYFKDQINFLESRLGSKQETREAQLIPEVLCVFAFSLRIFQTENKEVWKQLWSLQKKSISMNLHEHVMFPVSEFMKKFCMPKKIYSSIDPKQVSTFIQEHLKRSGVEFNASVTSMYQRTVAWILQMTSVSTTLHVFNKSKDYQKTFDTRVKLIIKGLILSTAIRNLIRTSILSRFQFGYEVDESMRPGLLMLINLSKKMEEVLNNRDVQLMHDMMIKFMGLNIARMVKAIYKKLEAGKSTLEKELIIAAFKLNFTTLNHYPTTQRKMIIRLCSDFLRVKSILKESEQQQFSDLLWEFDLLIHYKEYYKDTLSCSFSYWIRDMMADFLGMMAKSEGEYFRLQVFLNSLEDSKELLLHSVHLGNPNELIDEYRKRVIEYINKNFLSSIVNALNDDLLLQSHHFYMIYELDKPNPYAEYKGDIELLLKMRNIVVLDRIIDIKELVELSISESMYNRVIYNQHNYRIYEVMRTLAKLKYDLDIGHSYIPPKAIEQGKVDILTILKQFMSVTQRFRYNMFNQSFIEVLGDSSRLRAFSIPHIVNSINTHGLGIIPTSVDIVYKFSLGMVNNFSQLMQDETLTSYLVREYRWFKKYRRKAEEDESSSRKYPFERAEKFYKELSIASTREKGYNIVEKFRQLVTMLGNALAFARILRTASYSYLSKNVQYVPFIDTYECSFHDTGIVLNYGSTMQECCRELDKLIEQLRESFSESTDFLRVIFNLTYRKLSTLVKENL